MRAGDRARALRRPRTHSVRGLSAFWGGVRWGLSCVLGAERVGVFLRPGGRFGLFQLLFGERLLLLLGRIGFERDVLRFASGSLATCW